MSCCCCVRAKEPKDEKACLSAPRRNRGCTDIIVFLLFVFFLCGMIFIAAFSMSKGDPFRLVYGTDSFGNTCDEDNTERAIPGIKNSGKNLKGRPYMFFMDITNPEASMRICVNKCPESDIRTPRELFDFSQQTGSLLCRYDINEISYVITNNTLHGPCPHLPVYKSESVLNRCIPTELVEIDKKVKKPNIANNIIAYLNNSNIFQKVLRDLYATWNIVVALCFVSVAFSVLLVLMVRFLASVVVWLIVVFTSLASLVGTAFLWWTFMSYKTKLDTQDSQSIPFLEVDINNEVAFIVFAIIASVLTITLLFVLVAIRKRLSLMSSLFKEAVTCIGSMPLLLIQPLWTFILLFVFFTFWVVILAFLCTAENPSMTERGYVVFREHETVTHFWWYHLFGLIWISEYIVACQCFVVSGAVARWYFTREKSQLGFPILGNIARLMVFHQGSVALGSLIVALFKLPRTILLHINKRLQTSETCCGRMCAKCCCCGMWCIEKCLHYISPSAYTVVAIGGKNFCFSAKKGHHILTGNALRVTAINSVSDFVLFLAKMCIVAATGAVSIVWLKSQEDLHFFAIPVLLVCIFAYYIAHCFMSVYEIHHGWFPYDLVPMHTETKVDDNNWVSRIIACHSPLEKLLQHLISMIIDAMLLCFCEDVDLNDGSSERPYFGSRNLIMHMMNASKGINSLSRKRIGSDDEETEPAQV